MEVAYRYQGQTHSRTLEEGTQVSKLLAALEVPPDAVLVTLAGSDGVLEPVPLTRRLQEGDLLELVTIASGG